VYLGPPRDAAQPYIPPGTPAPSVTDGPRRGAGGRQPGGRNIPVSVWLLRVWQATGGVPSYSYQPVSRFWTFQAIEGGWLLALALVLLAGTVWLVRRSE
jgi:hypothetical protein